MTLKRRNAPKVTRRRRSSVGGKDKKIALLTRERDEALARQIATADILRVISQSPTDVRPVFDSIVFTAVRLLRCDLAFVLLCDGATYSPAAVASPEGPHADVGPTNLPIDRSANFPSRAILDKKMLHLPDWSCIDLPEHELQIHKMYGVNSALYLPLLREGECIGLLTLVGKRPNIFGAAEIAQAESFRDQALIAIENARLFAAERQRTRELTESLQQQTATADVLKVISRSTFDLQTVLNTLVESAARLCEADIANGLRMVGSIPKIAASYGLTPELQEQVKAFKFPAGRGSVAGRALREGNIVHVHDVRSDPEHTMTVAAELVGARTVLGVPLLREGVTIGLFVLMRRTVRPFTDKQIELVSTFADQAVIAIENTRLFEAEQQRTRELTNPWSSRRPRRRCSRLSAALQAIFSQCLRPCWRKLYASATPSLETSIAGMATSCISLRRIIRRALSPNIAGAQPVPSQSESTLVGRMLATKTVVHVADVAAEETTLNDAIR